MIKTCAFQPLLVDTLLGEHVGCCSVLESVQMRHSPHRDCFAPHPSKHCDHIYFNIHHFANCGIGFWTRVCFLSRRRTISEANATVVERACNLFVGSSLLTSVFSLRCTVLQFWSVGWSILCTLLYYAGFCQWDLAQVSERNRLNWCLLQSNQSAGKSQCFAVLLATPVLALKFPAAIWIALQHPSLRSAAILCLQKSICEHIRNRGHEKARCWEEERWWMRLSVVELLLLTWLNACCSCNFLGVHGRLSVRTC